MSAPSPSVTASSYLDFNALARLKAEAAHKPDAAVRRTAEQFEAHFIQHMLQTMRAAVPKSDLLEGGNMDMYQDLMDKEVAQQMTQRGGLGLADMLEKQMQQFTAAPSTQDALQMRAAVGLPLQRTQAPLPLADPATSSLLQPPLLQQPLLQPTALQPERGRALEPAPGARAGAAR